MNAFTARRRVDIGNRRKPEGDSGIVMIVVVTTMVIVTMLVTAGLAYTVQSVRGARGDQDRNAALAAAQAGVDDYVAHLNRNDFYARQSPFADCANLAIKGPRAPVNSCPSWDSAAGWVPINAGDPKGPAFHYDVDASRLDATGVVDVKSTGRVGKATRTLQVAVGRGGSTDFLYYTDHEDADPGNKTAYPGGAPRNCAGYWWGRAPDLPAGASFPRSAAGWGCSEITFIGGDVLDGRAHFNDTPLLTAGGGKKPEFKQGLETSDPACSGVVRSDPTTYKLCDRTGLGATYGTSAPQYASPLYLPDNSAAFSAYPGCQYLGATRIVFNPDATMTVWSKMSTGLSVECGGNSPMNVTVPVPNDKVIYVSAETSGTVHQCLSHEIDGTTVPAGSWSNDDTNTGQYTIDENMLLADQFCGQGNVYLQGVVKGHVTIAAQNSIVLTGDLRLQGGLSGGDLVGLVAGNSVEVYHPRLATYTCDGTAIRRVNRTRETYCTSYSKVSSVDLPGWPAHTGAVPGIEVQASIQTLQHSFFVQQYNQGGPKGTLVVWGSIAQKWRGIVGTSNGATGYVKDYHYDKRLKYASPPYFPQFLMATWQGKYTGEIQPQYPAS